MSATPTRRSLPRPGGGVIALVALIAIAAGSFGLAAHGVRSGETTLPVKFAARPRPIERSRNPALFWTSIGVYAALGTGCLGLAAWGIRVTRREGR